MINTNTNQITSLRPIQFLASALFTAVLLMLFSPSTFAQAESTSGQAATATTTAETTEKIQFKYVAEECDSLTKLVRRALLTYDQVNDEIALTHEGIVYAETNIVQNMGAYLLDIGDKVNVDSDLVAKYANSSLKLSDAQISAWAQYTDNVDFTLATTQQPQNGEEVVDSIEKQLDPTPADQTNADQSPVDSDDGVSAGWWFAGVGTAAIVWYLLWKREEE